MVLSKYVLLNCKALQIKRKFPINVTGPVFMNTLGLGKNSTTFNAIRQSSPAQSLSDHVHL